MQILLHIGHYKTGTTALQYFLDRNREALRSLGLCYPTAGRPANDMAPLGQRLPQLSVLSLGLLASVDAHLPEWYRVGRDREPDIYDPEQQWGLAVDQLKESGCPIGILSSEEFIRFGEHERTLPLIHKVREKLESFDVRIVCYIRRPDRYLVAWYKQLIQMGLPVEQLRRSTARYLPSIHVDYMKAISPWINVFGTAQVTIRNYESVSQDQFGTISDMLKMAGIVPSHESFDFDVPRNPSLPNALIELKRIDNTFNRHTETQQRTTQILRFIEHHYDIPADHQVEVLSRKNKYILFEAFKSSHSQLAAFSDHPRNFFPGFEESLFHESHVLTDTDAAVRYAGIFATLSRYPNWDSP